MIRRRSRRGSEVPHDRPLGPPNAPFAMRLRLARAALLWERVWPACWPALAVARLVSRPGAVRSAAVAAGPGPCRAAAGLRRRFSAGAGGGVPRHRRCPTATAARRRIERASGLRHRPLQALADRPSAPLDPRRRGLWEAHRRRMAAAARRLRIGLPAAGLAARDPWGVRAVLAILLLLAAVDAGGDWRERLLRAVTPSLEGGAPAIAASLDIWVTPPEYTGLPPQFLRPENRQTIRIPIGSTLLAQVHGGGGAAVWRSTATPQFQRDRQGGFSRSGDAEIRQADRGVASRRGARQLADRDHPRQPADGRFRQAARGDRAAGAADRLPGDRRLRGRERQGGDPPPRRTSPATRSSSTLPLPGLHLKQAQATSYHDLTRASLGRAAGRDPPRRHRRAGPDRRERAGADEAARARVHNPVARAIIDQRKELVKDPNSRVPVAEILGDLRSRPQLYGDDAVGVSGARVAQQRLRLQCRRGLDRRRSSSCCGTPRCASRTATRRWRRTSCAGCERQLQDALAKNAPDQEIDRLMSEMRQALDRYLQALAENMARHPGAEPAAARSVAADADQPRSRADARPRPRTGKNGAARSGAPAVVAAAEHAGKSAHGAARAKIAARQRARRSR